MTDTVSSATRRNALVRVEEQLLSLHAFESVVLRLERAGANGPSEEVRGLATAAGDELLQHQRANGSWHDDVFATCDALRNLRDLQAADAYGRAKRPAVAWLRGHLGAAGQYGEGCDGAARHAAGACHHFVPPLCSPGHAGRDLGGARLPDGTTFGSDAEARLCAAARAFRELAAAGESGTAMTLQRGMLRRMAVSSPAAGADGISTPVLASILDALRVGAAADDAALSAAAAAVAARQRGEGSWPNGGDAILDALSRACSAGLAAARAPVLRAAEHIAWLHVARDARGDSPTHLLVAWRALRAVAD
jgi:hypothetical protein